MATPSLYTPCPFQAEVPLSAPGRPRGFFQSPWCRKAKVPRCSQKPLNTGERGAWLTTLPRTSVAARKIARPSRCGFPGAEAGSELPGACLRLPGALSTPGARRGLDSPGSPPPPGPRVRPQPRGAQTKGGGGPGPALPLSRTVNWRRLRSCSTRMGQPCSGAPGGTAAGECAMGAGTRAAGARRAPREARGPAQRADRRRRRRN